MSLSQGRALLPDDGSGAARDRRGTVIAALKAFIDQAPSEVAREEAEKLLRKLMEQGG